jgi:DNA-binding response OmpR family regulator
MAKILLVEDDSNLREIYAARLEAEGYEVVTAGDGEEGLAVAVKERPHLVIADVMMPKISGFDMLDILRTTPETKDVKVIVMTALSQDEDRQRGESLGADRYFVKSQVVLEDLVSTVKELLVDVPGGTPEAPANGPLVEDPAAQPDQPAPTTQQEGTTASTAGAATPTEQEVAKFAATDPLMNGTPPTPTDQSQEQPPTPPQAT